MSERSALIGESNDVTADRPYTMGPTQMAPARSSAITHGGTFDWALQIQRFRRHYALKQRALAEAVGVDQGTISRWERGRQLPELGMQRRLRTLMREQTSSDHDTRLKHWINSAMGAVVLLDAERTILAASAEYCAVHGVPQLDIMGRSAAPTYSAEMEQLWHQACELGLYRGDIASATVVSLINSLSGSRNNLFTEVLWVPTQLSSGEWALHSEHIYLSEEQFTRVRQQNGGAIHIVMMKDLVR